MPRRFAHHRTGSVLVSAMWICIALTAVAIVLCREMTVESLTTVQHLAQAKADAAEKGVEQLVLAWITSEIESPGSLDNVSMEQRELGDCYFWLVKANPDDEQTPMFGLTREPGKLDVNTASYDELMALPNMTEELASAIIDWRDADDEATGLDGAEDSYYMQLERPYHCKNSPFESIDELRLIKGATPEILLGADYNQNGTIEPAEMQGAGDSLDFTVSARGIMDYLTVYGVKGTTPYVDPAAATSDTTGATAPVISVIDPSTGTAVSVVDVNSGNVGTLMQQYVPGRGAPARPTTGFLSVFDWAVKAGLTGEEFAQIYPYIICSPVQTNTGGAGAGGGAGGAPAATTTTTPAKLDIMEASPAAMLAIGLDETEVQAIIDHRTTNALGSTQRTNVAWLLDIVAADKFTTANTDSVTGEQSTLGAQITGDSTVYSAEIVTVTKDGRAFKRVRIVVDASAYVAAHNASAAGTTISSTVTTPILIHREDRSSIGWPIDPAIRDALRSGRGLDQLSTTGGNLGPVNP